MLDLGIGINMLNGHRADGSFIAAGISVLVFTTLAPRLVDYAMSVVVHTGIGLAALSLGPDPEGEMTGRMTNFAITVIVSAAIAYKNESRRRDNLLLAWRLHRSRTAALKAGARGGRGGGGLLLNSKKRQLQRSYCGCTGAEAATARAQAHDAELARNGFQLAVGYICHEASDGLRLDAVPGCCNT